MNIIEDFITINPYSRGGSKLIKVQAIVLHWTANPGLSAKGNRNFYEGRKLGNDGYGSATYIIGYDGEIEQCMPENERAYHCGTSQIDPASGKYYTDWAREKFGSYAIDHVNSSPNSVTIGIEMCPVDLDGTYNDATWQAGLDLTAYLLKKYELTIDDVCTHEQIVGWKPCPMLFHKNPEKLDEFKQAISL